jgi:hypothetical protein
MLLVMGLVLAAPAAQAVDMSIFGDVGYQGSTVDDTGDSFAQGTFDLYGSQRIDSKTQAFFELVVEPEDDNDYEMDLERMYLSREITPHFSVSMGRFHTPMGYWNTTYHHGALIQDTILRPSFLKFEDDDGAVLPTHIVGLMGMGSVTAAAGEFGYDVMVGNASSLNTDTFTTDPNFAGTKIDVNNVNDHSDRQTFGARLIFKSAAIPLEVGVFGLHDPFTESGGGAGAALSHVGSELIGMTVYGGHFRYATPRFDVMGESYSFSNDDKAGGTGKHKAAAYYIQAGYRVTQAAKLIYRYEDLDFVAADPYFRYLGVQEGSRHVVDLRYDIDDTNAIKFEVARFEPVNPSTKGFTFYALQWAFLML